MNLQSGTSRGRRRLFTFLLAFVAVLSISAVALWAMNGNSPLDQTHRSVETSALAAGSFAPGPASTDQQRGKTPGIKAVQPLATLLYAQDAYSRPSAGSPVVETVFARTAITEARARVPVLRRQGRWLKVRLPGRPNGHTGWIRGKGTAPSTTPWRLAIDLSRRRVTVYQSGRPARHFEAVVGKPSTPTPTGEFFVEDSIALGPQAVGGPFALALSARSDVFQQFEGGPGQIALHGLEHIGGVPGTAVSHGCVRLPGDAMRWLAYRVGVGTPVTITR